MKTIVWGKSMADVIVEILKEYGVEATTAPDSGHTAVIVVNEKDNDYVRNTLFPLRRWKD